MRRVPRQRLLHVAVAVLVAGVLGVCAVAAPRVFAGHSRHTNATESNPTSSTVTPPAASTAAPSGPSDLTVELAHLAAAPAVKPARTGRITGAATTQPDLYAAAFVGHLLTQDYTQPRATLLAWVQAEATQTTEPLVVGLVPKELRDRLAVFSVTDDTDSTALVPTPARWAALARQDGHTTVTIDKVAEPLAWTDAVTAGQVTDPGVTAREVDATLTRHNGSRLTRTSLAVTLHLEGPPSRADWRFVTVVDVRAVPEGSS